MLTFLAGRLVTPHPFDAETLKHELPVLLAELDESYSPVDTPLQKATGERLWWRYPTRKQPAGIRDVVARATVGSLQYLEERCYVPDNAMAVERSQQTIREGGATRYRELKTRGKGKEGK